MSMAQPNPAEVVNLDQLILAWQNAARELARLKDLESKLRCEIVQRVFPKGEEGTNTHELGKGWQLKAVIKFNYNLGNRDVVNDMLDRLATVGEDGKFIAERLVKWSPELSISEYRKLRPEHKGICDGVLTIKPALPELKLIEPKNPA